MQNEEVCVRVEGLKKGVSLFLENHIVSKTFSDGYETRKAWTG